MGLEGGFEGEENAGFVELLDAAAAFADREMPIMQGINPLHLKLV